MSWLVKEKVVVALFVSFCALGSASAQLNEEKRIIPEEMHRWDRHIRGFRRAHNFVISTGISSGEWQVKSFGTLSQESFSSSGIVSKFDYSFHLPIYRGFGYLLGSSVGYHYESADRRSPFKPVAALMFPGVTVGLVYNVSPVVRLSTSFAAYLERHEGIEERDGIDDDPKISVTMQSYDLGLVMDIFYDLEWALRLEAHSRYLDYFGPFESEGLPVNGRIRKVESFVGLGLLYHLL